MKPTEPPRIEPSPLPAETFSHIGLMRSFWIVFEGFGLVICAIKLMPECPLNLILLRSCAFVLAALLTWTRHTNIRFFDGQKCGGDPTRMAHLRGSAVVWRYSP